VPDSAVAASRTAPFAVAPPGTLGAGRARVAGAAGFAAGFAAGSAPASWPPAPPHLPDLADPALSTADRAPRTSGSPLAWGAPAVTAYATALRAMRDRAPDPIVTGAAVVTPASRGVAPGSPAPAAVGAAGARPIAVAPAAGPDAWPVGPDADARPLPPAGAAPRLTPGEERATIGAAAARAAIDPQFLQALRRAENGGPGREFGVLSVPAPTYEDQARVAAESVRRSLERFEATGRQAVDPATGRYTEAFIRFFSHRYAPVGAANDPTNLNQHHARNLIRLYADATRRA
jgi:hypothetical protein